MREGEGEVREEEGKEAGIEGRMLVDTCDTILLCAV